MNWTTARLKDIAPSQASVRRFSPDESVWHLTLDQIESNTGQIVNKQIKPAGEAGNSTYVFDEENVLYSKLRPYLNKVVCPQETGIATTELVPLKPRPEIIDRDYLTYYLRSPDFVRFASATVAGVKMPRIIMEKFWNHELPLPPLTEQRRIVEILDQADALSKQRAEADAKAARILPALFYQMFGDPLTNPLGWDTQPFGTVKGETGLVTDGDWILSENMDESGDVRLLQLADIGIGSFLDKSRKFITEEKAKELGCTDVVSGDVLVSRMADPIGRACIVPELNQRAITAVDVTIVRPDRGLALPEYVVSLCNTAFFLGKAKAAASGTTRGRITRKNLERILVPLPPLTVQTEFVRRYRELEKTMADTARSNQILITIFDSLMHRAFSGILTAKWREAHMNELLQEMEHQARALG